jgi:SAM-dependent methyltransferase
MIDLKNTPIISKLVNKFGQKLDIIRFQNSQSYWENRYATGGNSGSGSYDQLAKFKSEVINQFVDENGIRSVIEFGCGDGNQLTYAQYNNYLGFDVSKTAIAICRKKFLSDSTKRFKLMDEYNGEKADISLSLDVIFHLVEDTVFESYINKLFDSSNRYVIIYSSNYDSNSDYKGAHVKHRKFTEWIAENRKDYKLIKYIPNKYPFNGNDKVSSFSDFYIYSQCN